MKSEAWFYGKVPLFSSNRLTIPGSELDIKIWQTLHRNFKNPFGVILSYTIGREIPKDVRQVVEVGKVSYLLWLQVPGSPESLVYYLQTLP